MTNSWKDYAEAAVMVFGVFTMIAILFLPAIVCGLLFGDYGVVFGFVGTLAAGVIGAMFLSALRHVRKNGRDLIR